MYDYKSILNKLTDEQIDWFRYQVRILGNYIRQNNSPMTNCIKAQINGFCKGLAYCGVITKDEAGKLGNELHSLGICGEELEL